MVKIKTNKNKTILLLLYPYEVYKHYVYCPGLKTRDEKPLSQNGEKSAGKPVDLSLTYKFYVKT